jgi:tetratricopeptide (TPR) repeat protein
MDSRRQEIVDAYSGLKTRTYFEMLGIERTANEQQVKEAYFRLAKRFHPDAHHDSTLSDLVDKLEAVFIKLGEAYETLKNARTRSDYEERLGRARPRGEGSPAGAGSASSGAPETTRDLEAERKEAEDAVRKAGWFFEKGQTFDAIKLLEPAIERLAALDEKVPGKLQLRARVLLAKAYLKNPNWVKQAEQLLQGVVHDDAQSVEGHFLLGTIYRERGLKSRATSMFRKVLELKPDHEEALAEVGPLTPAEPAPSGGGGLLGKLFRKG